LPVEAVTILAMRAVGDLSVRSLLIGSHYQSDPEEPRMRCRSTTWLVLAVFLSWQVSTLLPGAEEKRLTVSGAGRVEVRPDVMEVFATVTGSGELTGDALKKFRANRRRGIEAVTKLKVNGLEVKGSGIAVISNAAVQQFQQRFGNAQQGSASHTTFSETLTFAVPGIDHLGDDRVQELATKILDAAKDAGLTLGQPNDQNPYYFNYNSYRPQIVFFRLAHPEETRQKALDLAAKDARSKAEQMAKRLNVAVGKAVLVRDATNRQMNGARQVVNVGNADASTNDLSPTLHDITVEAVLSIEYEILN
jgi:uncharacterized protein YggE